MLFDDKKNCILIYQLIFYLSTNLEIEKKLSLFID